MPYYECGCCHLMVCVPKLNKKGGGRDKRGELLTSCCRHDVPSHVASPAMTNCFPEVLSQNKALPYVAFVRWIITAKGKITHTVLIKEHFRNHIFTGCTRNMLSWLPVSFTIPHECLITIPNSGCNSALSSLKSQTQDEKMIQLCEHKSCFEKERTEVLSTDRLPSFICIKLKLPTKWAMSESVMN